MSAATRAQAITRWAAVALMAAAVLTATASGFAQSYAGLYHWALDHGLSGWKAQSFPLLVDLFIIVGELGLFLLAIDAYVIHRRNMLSWLDFCLPLTIAMAGWTASLIFNIGHVGRSEFSYQATAAVPPIVSMLGLFVLLRTLHRYVSQKSGGESQKPSDGGQLRAIAAPVTLQQITLMPMRVTGPIPQIGGARADKALESGAEAARAAQATAETAETAERKTEQSVPATAQAKPGPAQSRPRPRHAAPEPAPELATVGAAARSSVNGHGTLDTNALEQPVLTTEPEAPAVTPESLRNVAMSALEQHGGDLAATLEAVRAEGYDTDENEIRRIRDNHWFPYAVYRLLAKHKGDGALVRRELVSRGVEFDPAALEELVRSWRA